MENGLAWLCIICLALSCLLTAAAYTPVVYPSLFGENGYAYHEDTGDILSVPGAVDRLLCHSGDEATAFVQRPCSDIVIFTRSNSITLQILNLSDSGVILPFHNAPRIETDLAARSVRLNAFSFRGPFETMDDDDDGAYDVLVLPLPDREAEASMSAPPPESSLDESETNAIGSDVGPEREDSVGEDDETAEQRSVAELEDDIPEMAGGADSVDAVVRSANETAHFLHSDGTIRSNRPLFHELELADLPRNDPLEVVIRFGNGVRRRIFVYRDTAAAAARVQMLQNETRRVEGSAAHAHFEFGVDFSEFVFNTPNEDRVECEDVREPLEKFSSRYLENRELEANDLRAMIDAEREFYRCEASLESFVPHELVQVTGVDSIVEGEHGELSLQRLRRGYRTGPSLRISFDVDVSRTVRVEVTVRSSAGVDLAGRQVEGGSQRYKIERRNRATTQSVNSARDAGTSTTVVASSAVATSVTATVGASMAASVTGTTVTSSAGSASMGGSVSGAVDLLSYGQRIYLVSKMAVPDMPENFRTFGDSLSWTMLDIRVPWRDRFVIEQQLDDAGNETVTVTTSGPDVTIEREEWIYEKLVENLFWFGVCSVSLLSLHFLSVAIFFTFRWDLPNVLRFPRLELYFLHWIVPAFAGACASLLPGNKNQRILGLVLMFLLPIPFVLWHVYLLTRHFFLRRPETFHVFYEVNKSSLKTLSERATYITTADGSDNEGQAKVAQQSTVYPSLLERFLWTPLFGPPYESGVWKTVEGPSNKFVDRFGPVFEDYRHIPGLRRNATFEISAEANKIQRGYFAPLRSNWNPSRILNVIQISGSLLQLVRMIFISCFILGEDKPREPAQASTLLILSLLYLLLLRIFRPHADRFELAMAMVKEVLETATYGVVLYLLHDGSAERQEVRRNLGYAMLCLEGFGFFLSFLENSLKSFEVIKNHAKDIWNRSQKDPRILKVIVKAQLQNPRYLERKYFRRWVRNSLGKGIYPGDVLRDKSVPFEEKFWADPGLALRHLFVPTCAQDFAKRQDARP